MSEDRKLARALGTTESPIIIHDSQLEKRDQRARAQLRTIPFFLELGVSRFVYDDLWAREFQLVNHGHCSPGAITLSDVSFPLTHIATEKQLRSKDEQDQGQEFISQADVTWELFKEGTEATGGQYVFVTDTPTPHIESRIPVPRRSVADQFNAISFEYEQLIHEYVKSNVESRLPLYDTKNLYFHRVSEHHATRGAPASELVELFDYERAPIESPVWEPLHFFIEHELEEVLEEYEAHVTTALRSWIEWGDTEKIAKRMIATLHRCNFDSGELTEYQHSDQR
ncbi:hypothetical protein [Halapricum hydrolyticum]|uniref:Uncharacterized protein n=1 Tax=Halapricum hydrolyticum TaxID=2979991 RepID=A0AAE3IE42_9EURY|nr:hypothetical protein [Halapricum hydrolyticum]MCU4717582.1 hypothetical protein [Halapricum hydrolyticum]MCU4726889.1 hypothetical protein [Halapricum hydrolyticum]